MCGVYINADPILYESRTRSLRIHGVITTVRLENLFWDVLQEIAARENLTTSQFAVKLYDELIDLRGELPTNFASFLRVCCLRYLSMREAKKPVAKPDLRVNTASGSALTSTSTNGFSDSNLHVLKTG
ncbi:ribbon-helix-helix domain-containing protein [Caballeronia sp. BR00000012568055]|uniref:ribbon-helix-helix domain-containing protein n=1 Tax=Caballeronia sp. BR00000012568055 TaxID=2918761 RepID=UPI0023F6EB0A|nr:ribbon-helix-helix domain-containing protein [Caballeronia sp. BR00000012568055]